MPSENGLPPYTSRHPTTKLYRYFRRPPTGVDGSVFSRSYATRDKKVVWAKYPAFHAQAEVHFERQRTGRSVGDGYLRGAASAIVPGFLKLNPQIRLPLERNAFRNFINDRGGSWLEGLTEADKDVLTTEVMKLYASDDLVMIEEFQKNLNNRAMEARALVKPPVARGKLTLRKSFEEAWKPAAERSKNTVVEVGRYVEEFVTLNGELDLEDYTREHWGAWRADCLAKHGPGPTAFKRFSMMKTIVNEAIRAGLFERKFFAGQDITMKKPRSKKLRNEGWLADELVTWFSSPLFKGAKTSPRPDADYWISVIIAYTGARLSEVTSMQVGDVAERHGLWTFFLAKERGKTEDSRRVIPIPKAIIKLGFMSYLARRPKVGPLFEGVSPKLMSQTYARLRADLGLTRKGCDVHAHRHHIKTLLSDLHCPDRVSDYVTGHAPPSVSGRYGKTELTTALKFLDKIDLGVTISRWRATN